MADVFISYSRRDEAFVERLRGALAERGKDVWLDREDIGPAVEWRRELELGIEASDVFAFVISPDSLRSEPCRREREYAASKGKRIVPMLRSEPDGIEVPEELASRNYIFVRTDDEFEPGVAALLAAIDDLPEWARDHTRLLERAEEWDHHQRDPSFLLRGSDLSEAERWLAEQGAHKEPQPTALQTEYLLASRKVATRRQRLTIGAGAVALVVSVALGLLALLQRNEAQDQRDEAVRQAQLAKSRELAAASVAAVRTDPWEALALAVSAAEATSTPESTAALRGALEAPRESAVLAEPGAFTGEAVFIGDGDQVLTASFDRDGQQTTRRWDLLTGESTRLRVRPATAFRQSQLGDLSPDRTLRVSARGFDPRLSDARVGTVLIQIERLGFGVEGPRAAQFSPDGRSFLTVGPDGAARVWPLTLRGVAGGRVAAAAIGPDGRDCVTATAAITVSAFACAHGSDRRAWRFPELDIGRSFGVDTAELGFGTDGPLLSVSTSAAVTGVDVESGTSLFTLPAATDRALVPKTSSDGSLAVRALGARRAEVIDAVTETQISTLDVSLRAGNEPVAFSGDGGTVAVADYSEPVVRVWDLNDPAEPAEFEHSGGEGGDLDLSADGSMALVAIGTSAEVWDVQRRERLAVVGGRDLINTAEFGGDERFIVTGANDGRARVWETATGRPVADYPVDPGAVRAASLSANGQLLTAGFQGSAFVFDCVACAQPPELLAEARAELESRPASSASPAGP